MRFIKMFGLLILLQGILWIGSHVFFSANKSDVLLVVDTSFSMKPNFPSVKNWIENYQSSARYKNVTIGTDKASLGELPELASMDVIFRTSFGNLNEANLKRLYSHVKAKEKILLSDGTLKPEGWDVVAF